MICSVYDVYFQLTEVQTYDWIVAMVEMVDVIVIRCMHLIDTREFVSAGYVLCMYDSMMCTFN